jgi:hypothetical protein
VSGFYLELLTTFGFDEMQMWIATISLLLFTANFLGGIISGLMFVHSADLVKRPLKDRLSFRMFCLAELILVIFIFFYHVFMIETILVEHVIYWFSAMLMMPLLAVIASQTILVSFSGKIAEKEQQLKRIKEHQRKAKIELEKQMAEKAAADSKRIVNPFRE